MLADPSSDAAYLAATKSKDSLRDWLTSIELINNAELKNHLYGLVSSLLRNCIRFRSRSGRRVDAKWIQVDFFQPNPPNVAIETLLR